MSEIIYRPAAPADIPALSRLASESFIAKFGPLYSQENLDFFLQDSLSESAVAAELANPDRLYRLAEQDGKLLAFCKLGLSCGFPGHARGSNVLELKQLYTDPAATGQGLGAALMDWAMTQFAARGADEVQISVYAHNDGAQRFYRRYGFEKVADITFRVGDHIDPEFLFAQQF